jgi:drug/metabolite transporter (DMT)-like permease
LFNILSVIGQAVGFVSSHVGMNAFADKPVPAFSATLIRVGSAGIFCWGVLLFAGRARETAAAFRDRRLFSWLLFGVVAGPVVGIWFSMVALQGASTGIASTLISLSPLVLIPLSWFAYREKPTLGRVIATVVALAGVALMMLKLQKS